MLIKDIKYNLANGAFVPWQMGTIAVNACDNMEPLKCFSEPICEMEIINQLIQYGDDHETDVTPEIEVPLNHYKKYVHYFLLELCEDTDLAFLPRIHFGECRYWINGELAFIGNCEDGKHSVAYKCKIKKGINVIAVEHVASGIPYIKVDFADDESICALADGNMWFEKGDFQINYNEAKLKENCIFEFNILPVDTTIIDFDCKMNVCVTETINDSVLYEDCYILTQTNTIDLSGIVSQYQNNYNLFEIRVTITGKDGGHYSRRVVLSTAYVSEDIKEQLIREGTLLLANDNCPIFIKNEISYCVENLDTYRNDGYCGYYLRKAISNYYDHQSNSIYTPGVHYIYYYSEIDCSYRYYYIVIPENYDKQRRYPLLLTISHGHIENRPDYENSNNYSHHLKNYSKDVIYADIGGQGCSIGSYMGELFILNEISHIKKTFSIDENRVYAVGHCAGNISVFNIAIEHPDLFAGIYLRRAVFDFERYSNIVDLPIYYAHSEYNKSDELATQKTRIQNQFNKFNFIELKDTYGEDLDMIRIQYTRASLDMLFSNIRNPYPNRIDYRVTKNRLLRIYYTEIESIEKGKAYGFMSVRINSNKIEISCKNITGIKVHIPPQIDLHNCEVFLNRARISDKAIDNGNIIMSMAPKNTDIYKGNGLLDVYCSNLSIIKTCDTESNNHIADTMSRPESNATYRLIYVNYPIGDLEFLKESKNRALIIIDSNYRGNNEELKNIREHLKIIMTEDGYTYKGQHHFGPYVIMQVINNPWDNKKSLLYINSNSEELISKHFFLRKMILPSYSSGFHPYLNIAALLYDGKKYYGINEWGECMREI